MTVIDPAELELRYMRVERRIYRYLARSPRFLGPFVGLLFLLVLVFITDKILAQHVAGMRFPGALGVLQVLQRGAAVLLIFSLVQKIVSHKIRLFTQLLTTFLVWCFTVQPVLNLMTALVPRVAVFLFLPVVVFSTWLLLRYCLTTSRRKVALIVYSVHFWLLALGVSVLLREQSVAALDEFWAVKLQFFWLSGLVTASSRSLSKRDLAMPVNAVNGLRGVIWPRESIWNKNQRRNLLWWHGWWSLTIGYGFGILALLIFINTEPALHLTIRYPMILLADVAVFNIIAGLARVQGHRVRDATHFVFLSRRPTEFWRRGNVYVYDFVFRYVYFPLWGRLSRSVYLMTLLAFSVFFLFHYGLGNFLAAFIGPHDWLPHVDSIRLLSIRIHFLLSFLVICVTQKYWFFSDKPRTTAHYGWISILITHAIMYAVDLTALKAAVFFH